MLQYIIHRQGTTLANKTTPFIKYDEIKFEVKDGSLFLVCEYGDVDFNTYKYLVTYDGENITLTPEK